MPDGEAPPFVTTGTYPVRGGNGARLLIDGEPVFRRICEAIEGAQRRVWATITFMWPDFVMPDGRGSALNVLERAAERGADVRLLAWRPDVATAGLRRTAFWGAPEHFERLRELRAPLRGCWHRAHPGHCQHRKTWLVDAGEGEPTTFVGRIDLTRTPWSPL